MKKFLIVLLVAVLAVGFAFADASFSGSANIDFGYDLDTQAWGFVNGSSTDLDWTLTLGSGEGSSTGEGDLYAVVEGSFSIDLSEIEDSAFTDAVTGTTVLTGTDATATATTTIANALPGSLSVSVDTANIVYKDLTVGILDAGTASDYAYSYYLDDDDDPEDDMIAMDGEMAPGFTVSYNDLSGGFGTEGDIDGGTYAFFGWASVADYALTEEVSLSAAGFGYLANGSKNLGFTAKAAYTTDELTADAAVDFNYDNGLEVAANATYGDYTANAYVYSTDMTNYNVNAMLSGTYDPFTVSVDGRDLLDAYSLRSLEFSESATFDAITEEVSVTFNSFSTLDIDVSETLTYTADMFEAYETVSVNFTTALNTIEPELGISSDTVVDNATLSLTWSGADFLGTALGAVTASCEIDF